MSEGGSTVLLVRRPFGTVLFRTQWKGRAGIGVLIVLA